MVGKTCINIDEEYILSLATVQVSHVYKESQADSHTYSSDALKAAALFLGALFLAVICGVAWLYRDTLQRWIK